MSGFASQYDEAELERQLQEEFRRRQSLQVGTMANPQATAFSTLTSHARPADYSHLGMLGGVEAAASGPSYYGRQPAVQSSTHHTAASYGRVTSTPYAGLGETQQTRSSYSAAEPASSPLAQLYASQQHQKQQAQAIQQAVAANYAAAYGAPSSTPTASTLEQRYAAAYGLPSAQSASSTASFAQQSPAAVSSQTAQEIAIMRQAFNQEREAALKRSQGQYRSPSVTSSSPTNKTSNRKNPVRTPLVKSAQKKKDTAVLSKDKDGKPIVEDRGTTWYMGCVPLGVDDDKYWLSELQVFLRSNFAEGFAATEEDIAAPMHGRNKPIALGQVGIRCMHCKDDNPAERGQQATSYPSLISGIYNSVQQMLRLHLDCCLSMPAEVRQKIEQLKVSCSSRGGRKQYWVDSAKRLGLVDTPNGIHFVRDPLGPLPPLTGPSVNSKENRRKKAPAKPKKPPPPKPKKEEPKDERPPLPVDDRPLVFPEDEPLISDYLYLTLQQMAPCTLMEADRVGCYKTRRVGFPGLACRHCTGQAGCGRYFPASEASLSQTTTSQTIMNHVRNCRRCPIEIRENLEIMKRSRMGPDGKRADKPKHGGRKVFFHRLWCRIQGLPIEEEKGKTRRRKRKQTAGKRKKRKQVYDSDLDHSDEYMEDDHGAMMSSEEETETEVDTDDESAGSIDAKPRAKRKSTAASKKKGPSPWVEGCVRLTKTDDPHWLSEMECFARSDLVEVFTYSPARHGELDGYGGRKEPAEGQVGIRCVFCKSLDPAERPNGCVSFPDALSSIHAKVADMIRLHFPGCPSIPEDARQTFRSLRGFDAKVASDDSHQYWVDSARDIGLANIPPGGSRTLGAWGITFRRDPLQPSPADELDLESAGEQIAAFGKNMLVKPDDRGLCTDQVMLLLRQVRPCRFQKSDRRAGPGSRGRDRVMGFPGLCCMHCTGRNTLGRYFPVSAKNLTDSTANSLQAHVSSCTRCPEPIKASLAYLSHRSILQKAELSGSWKKAFFKKVWDRLHVEREWNLDNVNDGIDYSSADDQHGNQGFDNGEEDSKEEGSDSEKEELGDHMNALIKAAAIWLTEQDAATESSKSAARAGRGRSLPGKRPMPSSPSRGGRGTNGLPTKRRRVHF